MVVAGQPPPRKVDTWPDRDVTGDRHTVLVVRLESAFHCHQVSRMDGGSCRYVCSGLVGVLASELEFPRRPKRKADDVDVVQVVTEESLVVTVPADAILAIS